MHVFMVIAPDLPIIYRSTERPNQFHFILEDSCQISALVPVKELGPFSIELTTFRSFEDIRRILNSLMDLSMSVKKFGCITDGSNSICLPLLSVYKHAISLLMSNSIRGWISTFPQPWVYYKVNNTIPCWYIHSPEHNVLLMINLTTLTDIHSAIQIRTQ